MKIIFCLSSMNCGGAEKVAATICNVVAKKHDVTILTIASNKKYSFYQLNPDIKLKTLGNPTDTVMHGAKRIKQLRQFFATEKPDIIVSFLPQVIIYTFFAAKKLNIPFVVSERNNPKSYSLPIRLLLKHIFKKSSGCVFQTRMQKEFYFNKNSIINDIIPNPIFVSSNNTIKGIKRDKAIVSVGRLEKQKNFPLLIESFSIFLKNHPDYILKIYGVGSEYDNMIKIIKTNNLSNKVFLLGLNNNWHKDEENSAAFVSSSDFEGMPNALAEALVLGLPCLSTDCPSGGPKELKKMYPDLILTPVGEHCKMAEYLSQLVESNEYNGGHRINYLSPDIVSEKWLELFEKVLNDKR